ncbi:hypothetical protein PV328_004278 [Microctonus aethiopoides]|uniref:THAP-type domain-containing protein n=1 Tax=Microctonus aethiopoides TaxID=144406 RepID=A0AA39KLD7_9HYME|nr:hypothetical protein PV328_004278 [Microctonus aethiopoides]
MNKTRLYCAVPDCKSKASVNVDLSYHRFPPIDKYNVNVTNYFGDVEKVDLYSQWKKVTNIPNPGPNDRICSQHFTAADYCRNGVRNQRRKLKHHAIPSLHLPIINEEKHETNEKRLDKVKIRAINAETEHRYENNVPEPMENDIEISKSVQSTTEAGENFEMAQMVIEGNAANILPKVSMSEDVGVQTTIENDSQDVGVQVQSGELAYKFTDFIKNDAQLRTMTGIENFEILTCIENLTLVLYKSKNDLTVRMSLRDKIIMTFIKLKQNISYSCLSIMFNCYTSKNCATIFQDTIVLLCHCMKSAISWPSRQEISRNIPLCFSNFTDVRVVLDCIKIFNQSPSKLCCELVTYSHNKSSNTVKCMIGVTPAGNISYISKPYGGCVSDKVIFEQSDILNLLEPSDGIMVVDGFLIDEIGALNKWKYRRPLFSKGKEQFEKSEAILTGEIEKAREHIERSNRRIKKFKILSNPLPYNLVPFTEEIFTIICATINLSAPLISNEKFLNM